MARLYSLGLTALLASLFAYAFLLRVTSLEGLPDLNGDEVWHAIQLTHLVRGDSFSLLTENGLPLSPIHAALEIPFLLAFKPSLWVVRLPALLTGIASVVLMYVLGTRMLDRTTALIAAALLAALPVAVIYSRVSYESSHAPLYGILILYFAHRLNMIAVVLMLASSYFIHPTTIFLLPVLLAVVWERSRTECPGDPVTRRRRMLARMAAITGVVLAVGISIILRPRTRELSAHFDSGIWGRHDILDFWLKYEWLFLGSDFDSNRLRSWLFWTVLLPILGSGLWRLVSARRWDRVAFVVGPVLAALALFAVGGSNIISPGSTRYGLFLVVPTVLAVACLVNTLMVDRNAVRFHWLRRLQCAGALAVGWGLLLSVDLNHMIMWSVMRPGYQDSRESPWTFGADARPPVRRLWSLLRHDIAARTQRPSAGPGAGPRSPGGMTLVIAEDPWRYGPLEWLATSRRDIQVVDFSHLLGNGGDPSEFLKDCLRRGGYAATFDSSTRLEAAIRSLYPASALREWTIPMNNGQPFITLYRLRRGTSLAGRADATGDTGPASIALDWSGLDH
jgi:4-amino-4-deoxy-L-arabinose transferase-like glycosyltransferase